MIPIITVQGPTAAGKTGFAVELAKLLETEIISADSRQIYKYLNIGTAKPTAYEMQGIKHHLIDIISPKEVYDAGRFSDDASDIINELHSKNKIPIICGGTGFYIKALTEGLFRAPEIPDNVREALRKQADENGKEWLQNELKRIDPESAERIEFNDVHRMLRALEVYRVSGKTITEHWKGQTLSKNYETFNILISQDRAKLYERINLRVLKMIDNGLISEVEDLIRKGYIKSDPGMKAVGYKELFPYFNEGISKEECIEKIQQNSRNYAKRQLTWYRKLEFDLTLAANDINFYKIQKRIQEWEKGISKG
jgi:tRNA dimethylallyltransferase